MIPVPVGRVKSISSVTDVSADISRNQNPSWTRKFRRWRQQARLLHALERLAAGDSVTTTALEVGFNGTSAFIAMFRRALGRTPGSYFRAG